MKWITLRISNWSSQEQVNFKHIAWFTTNIWKNLIKQKGYIHKQIIWHGLPKDVNIQRIEILMASRYKWIYGLLVIVIFYISTQMLMWNFPTNSLCIVYCSHLIGDSNLYVHFRLSGDKSPLLRPLRKCRYSMRTPDYPPPPILPVLTTTPTIL